MKPLVSVIIPTWNRAHLIAQTLESVYAQTWDNLEVIVVDDGSTDSTREAVEPFIEKGLVYLKQVNAGAPSARNAGLSAATGTYVAFLDSDDRWRKTKLERQMEKMLSSSGDTALVYCGIEKVDADGNTLGYKVPKKSGRVFLELLEDNFIGSTSAPLIRASALDDTGGFDATLRSRQDLDLWLRLARSYRVAFVPEALVQYLVHADRISANLDSRIQGYSAILEKYAADITAHPRLLALYHYYLGWFYFRKADGEHSRKHLDASLRAYFLPKALYYRIRLAFKRP